MPERERDPSLPCPLVYYISTTELPLRLPHHTLPACLQLTSQHTQRERERGLDMNEEMPLVSLNHVSFLCRSVIHSVKFYEEVLGFVSIKRPSSFDFSGAWLFNYGTGIHLLQCNSPEDLPRKKEVINPKDNHISFQCSNMNLLKRKLAQFGIHYVTAVVEEGGIQVDQLFFHDPDGYMIEICNCENLPVLPISSCPLKQASSPSKVAGTDVKFSCRSEIDELILNDLVANMLHLSF